ncbi:transaldolase [Alkalimarinus alittae]|uniref:Transaldolase n=1 Tax=Alkalimarinus alittae TaxID=2961619 RepID=A0ABY6MY75_9ALTE|nr:transaldolase [Alkalimarinus alittae]UZE94729.1 transaldolase [Alkalimarinus alittae]
MENKLEQLRKITTVVADTGDIEAIKRWKPEDATTNPSLLLNAAEIPEYQPLIEQSLVWASQQGGDSTTALHNATDYLSVLIGKEILNCVPGKVSTEVDARLSFDTQATVDKARKLISLYEQQDVDPKRVLIKIASTWEGIKAAEILEKEGIHCNLTLLFSFTQAAAAAEAGAYLISPFVGRILDWYKKDTGITDYPASEDPGVLSVTEIYNFYKENRYDTVVMGASFRNTGEIEQLAGCDRLTISPALMEALSKDTGELSRKLFPNPGSKKTALPVDEKSFRWELNADPMATEKLAEGIRKFAEDQVKLEQKLKGFTA